jgi:hypothetical protein
MPDFLIPGLGPYTPFVRGIVAALRPGGSTPATAETTAAYELERSRQQQEELWDYPFGAPTQSIIGSMSPAPAPSGGMTSPAAPTPPPPAIPAPAAASPLDNAIRATEASPFEREIRATEADRRSFERQIRATEASPGAFAFGGVLRVLGGLGALLWPSPIGSGELSPEELRENERRWERAMGPPEPPDRPGVFAPMPNMRRVPVPVPAIPVPRVRLPPFDPVFQSPMPAPLPVPAPAPVARSSTTPSARTQPLPRWLLGPLASAAPSPLPFSPFSGSVTPATTFAPESRPLTALETAPLPSRLEPFSRDHCEPRTRKPRRKCRVRAPLIWAGGPKTGQPAGARCIDFED